MLLDRRRLGRVLGAAVAAAMVTGCASQVDFDSVRREQREMSRRLADTRADLDSLRQSMAALRGQVEDTRYRGGARGGPDLTELDRRLQALESRGQSSEPATASAPEPPTAAAAPPGPPSTVTSGPMGAGPVARVEPARPGGPEPLRSADIERDLARSGAKEYRDGLQQFQRGEYDKAIQTLRGFVAKNPGNELASLAHYWIGEAYFAQHKYNEAILSFNEIVVNSPKNERVPAARLRQGMAFAAMGDTNDARIFFQQVITEHPGTEEASKAKQQLLKLGT
jgi:tol-pal system protein YbgF